MKYAYVKRMCRKRQGESMACKLTTSGGTANTERCVIDKGEDILALAGRTEGEIGDSGDIQELNGRQDEGTRS